MTDQILVLVGSPKGVAASASGRLARVVVDRMEVQGWSSEWLHVHHVMASSTRVEAMIRAVDEADLVLLAAPLYVDSLPAPVIAAMTQIAEHRRAGESETVPKFATLLNCGFLEPVQNLTAQGILENFAEACGFEWYGGLSLGAAGHTSKRIAGALKQTADTLALNLPISSGIEEMTRDPVMPKRAYVIGGNAMWKRSAKKLGTQESLRARPYTQEPKKQRRR